MMIFKVTPISQLLPIDFSLPNFLTPDKNYTKFQRVIKLSAGTAAVAVGGLLTAEKIVEKKITDMKILFVGAGEVN